MACTLAGRATEIAQTILQLNVAKRAFNLDTHFVFDPIILTNVSPAPAGRLSDHIPTNRRKYVSY
jgi:hypothetical protein